MVIVVLPEEVHVTTVGREGFILQLFKVDELRLVYIQVIEREGVGGSLAVLRDDGTDGPVIERDGVLPVGWRDYRFRPSQLLGRFHADEIMLAPVEPPSLPVLKHGRKGIGKASLGIGRNETAVAARHALHVAQVEGGMQDALSDTTTAHDYSVAGADEVYFLLCRIEILFYHNDFSSSFTSSVGVYSRSCSL